VDWRLSIVGLLIGALVGATGMGGGSLLTPILVLLFGFKPSMAIGTDILHGAIFKSFGAWRHRQLGTVSGRLTLWMLAGSAPMSLAGVAVATWLERRYGEGIETTQKQILGVALLICGLGFLAKALIHHKVAPGPFVMDRRGKLIAIGIGLIGGFVVGLTSVGSGTFFGLAMLVIFPIATATVVGTDIFHAALLLWVAGAGHIVAGNVDLAATGSLLVGSIPGVLLGSHVMIRLPDRALRIALATTLSLSGLKLLDVPGSSVIVVVGLGLMVAALVVYGAWQLVQRRRRALAPAVAAEPAPTATD
jgi:uncharacterized membrane protein YfcA